MKDYEVKTGIELKNFTTIKIGGEANLFFEIFTVDGLKTVVKNLDSKKIKYMLIGNGSNLLFSDEGYGGAILKLNGDFFNIERKGKYIIVGAGVNMFALNQYCVKNALTGLEWSYGIPGTIGGAVYMNAGAYGDEISNYIVSVKVFDENYCTKDISRDDCDFLYRHSAFQNNRTIILSVVLNLENGSSDDIYNKMNFYLTKRKETQPNLPSAGSVFKKHNNVAISRVIDECGLKGMSMGGAKISEKHAGFIVNYNSASCKDVLNLIKYIRKIIKSKVGFSPELEIIIVEERI